MGALTASLWPSPLANAEPPKPPRIIEAVLPVEPLKYWEEPGWQPPVPNPVGDGQAVFDQWVEAGQPGYTDAAAPTHEPPQWSIDWDALAACVSGGDWSINTGSDYFGGLGFWQPTWQDFGGLSFGERADLATKAEQIIVAEATLAVQGIEAWGQCGRSLQPALAAVSGAAAPAEGTVAVPDSQPASSVGQAAANEAMKYLGWLYVGDGSTWGGSSPSDGGFDCSGLMQWSYAVTGVSIPRSTWDQRNTGWAVPLDQIAVGDLVFSNSYGHVGMYVGDGMVIHAPSPGSTIQLTPLADIVNWYGFNEARRMA